MRFGPVPIEEAVGAIAAHSVRHGDAVLRKGSRIDAAAAARLKAAGVQSVTVARLEPGDIGEDEAAERLARAAAGPGVTAERPFTGRSNLFAETAGVLTIDQGGVDRLNAVDEAITVATLPAFRPVVAREMVATVKIIPYAVSGKRLEAAIAAAGDAPLVSVAPYRLRRIAVISTLLPGLKESVVAKTLHVLERRLEPTGARIVADRRVPHDEAALAEAIAAVSSDSDLIIVFGASAIADRRDVIPAALERAAGEVEHFGMPVDPGNLLLLGRLGQAPVIGAPGCARSPKENGFDWLLHRLLAGLPVTRRDIVGLGVGGLLMEIVSRPQPRAGGESEEEGG